MNSTKKMIVTTTSTLEGWTIKSYLGTVSTHVVAGTGFFSDLFASFSDVFGGRSQAYQTQLSAIHEEAIERIKQKAISIGANAVIGLQIDHDEISGKDKQMFMVTAIGTAVSATRHRQEQLEGTKDYQSINQDEFSSLVRRRQVIRSAQEGTLQFDDDTWNFLTKYQVHEVALTVSLTVAAQFDKGYTNEGDDHFFNQSKEYFLSLPDEISKQHLYSMLKKDSKLSGYALELIDKRDLLDIESLKQLLQSAEFETRKRALQLLAFDKRDYNAEDIKAFESLLSAIELNVTPRGERITEKGLLSSKIKELWKCECGGKVDIAHEQCHQCQRDIYGFYGHEIGPERAKRLILDKIAVLKEAFVH